MAKKPAKVVTFKTHSNGKRNGKPVGRIIQSRHTTVLHSADYDAFVRDVFAEGFECQTNRGQQKT